eukprot:3088270-Pleurochrysis_carterae.AAC.1
MVSNGVTSLVLLLRQPICMHTSRACVTWLYRAQDRALCSSEPRYWPGANLSFSASGTRQANSIQEFNCDTLQEGNAAIVAA